MLTIDLIRENSLIGISYDFDTYANLGSQVQEPVQNPQELFTDFEDEENNQENYD